MVEGLTYIEDLPSLNSPQQFLSLFSFPGARAGANRRGVEQW